MKVRRGDEIREERWNKTREKDRREKRSGEKYGGNEIDRIMKKKNWSTGSVWEKRTWAKKE